MSLADRIDRIFSKPVNFDISGFCDPELVTVDLADEIIHMTVDDRRELLKRGYGFSWFNEFASDGIIWKEFRHGSIRSVLKLYYNEYYPKEIELTKKEREKDNG